MNDNASVQRMIDNLSSLRAFHAPFVIPVASIPTDLSVRERADQDYNAKILEMVDEALRKLNTQEYNPVERITHAMYSVMQVLNMEPSTPARNAAARVLLETNKALKN